MTATESGVVTALLTFGGIALGWLMKGKKINAEAKKTEAEAEGGELENVQRAIRIWREVAEDLKKEMALLQRQYNQLSERYTWLEGEHKTILKENQAFKERIKHLETIIEKS